MGIFSFFSKKKDILNDENINLNFVQSDVHGHLLPELDDGSQSMEESIAMIKALQQLGYKKLTCTPHVMNGHYQNTTREIKDAHLALTTELNKQGIHIELNVAAEYNFDSELIKRLDENDILSFGNDDYQYLLFELSYFNEPMGLDEIIAKIKSKGYIPVLAHPERYPYFSRNRKMYTELQQKGVVFQMNINSLSGLYPGDAKVTAEWLMENDMIQFIGTDIHRIDHVEYLEKAFKFQSLHDYVNHGRLMNQSL